MYLMYVDESGDSGMKAGSSPYFVLSGLVIHETRWRVTLNRLLAFRQKMRSQYGLLLKDEIHAFALISKPGSLVKISRNDRLSILREFLDEINTLPSVKIVNVVVTKNGKPADYDPFVMAWEALIQRMENTIKAKNFPGPKHGKDCGIILPDDTNRKQLTQLLRRMRRFNPVPSMYGSGTRSMPLKLIIEDPVFKDSQFSFFAQAADCVAYSLYQKLTPNRYMRKRAGDRYFDRLNACLCRDATPRDPQGIVRL